MIKKWIDEVKLYSSSDDLGMILIHNGIVRGTSKDGKKVKGLHLSYDKENLDTLIKEYEKNKGIVAIKVWINEGTLKIGDDIMYVLVAGRLQTDVIPVFKGLLSKIKKRLFQKENFLRKNFYVQSLIICCYNYYHVSPFKRETITCKRGISFCL